MKKIILAITAIFTLSTMSVNAQSPEEVNYQAVARDASGNILPNQSVGVEISILSGSATGTVEYTETHNVTTNDFGLMNLTIGSGTVASGNFSTIDWSNNDHFVQISMDLSGGSNYTLMGTSQLVSVPYALYADQAESAINDQVDDADADPANEIQTMALSGNSLTISGGNTVTLPSNADNLGNHVATTNIELGSNYLSGDGGNEGITVDGVGEVGIMTATPSASLHLTQDGTGISDGMRYTSSNGNGQDWYWFMTTDDDFHIRDDASDVMTFENGSDYVGINTSAPTANLSVSGTANKSGGGSWAVFSDRRIKRDVKTYEGGLDEVLAINPVKFKYNKEFAMEHDPDHEFVGVIAQEMKEVAPYTVETFEYEAPEKIKTDGENEDAKSSDELSGVPSSDISEGEELLSFDPSALDFMLVNAIKEQQKIIEDQKSENDKMRSEIENLKSEIEAIKSQLED